MTTKTKPLKDTKLRNAEYYNFQEIQDELYKQSQNNKIFKKLMDKITMEENILLAYRNIKKNKGSKTAGVDKMTIDDIAKWKTENFIRHIRKKFEWYQPKAVKRVEIPKSNGKTRPLGIPTIIDRIIQQCILQVLEPICEAKFSKYTHGFRPCRSVENAMAQTYMFMQATSLHYVVDIDIKGFFDNVNHGKLLKQMWYLGIRDKKLLSIISTILKAEVATIGFPEKGTPQGGIISPLLSNIVLNELDWWILSQWENMPTKHQFSQVKEWGTNKARGLRQCTKLKECHIVRYADDFKIFCRTREDANKLFIATKQWLKERLDLDISEEKSKIVNLKNKYSEYLGFKIKVYPKYKKHYKKGDTFKYVVKSHMSNKALKKAKTEIKTRINDIRKASNKEECFETVNKYNAYILGIHNYYRIATNISVDCEKLSFIAYKNLKKLGKRVKRKEDNQKIPTYIPKQYHKSKQLRYIGNVAIIPVGYIKNKNPLQKKKKINKYTQEGREEIHKELSNINPYILIYLMKNYIPNRSIEYNDNRLAVYVAQKGKCNITGKTLEIGKMHCHHIKARKNKGKDSYNNLIFVTDKIHKLIHATNSDKITQYQDELKLDKKQLEKLNKLREQIKLPAVTITHHLNS